MTAKDFPAVLTIVGLVAALSSCLTALVMLAVVLPSLPVS